MKKVLNNMNRPLLIVTSILLCFGLIMIQSASSMESYMRYAKSPYYYFTATVFDRRRESRTARPAAEWNNDNRDRYRAAEKGLLV